MSKFYKVISLALLMCLLSSNLAFAAPKHIEPKFVDSNGNKWYDKKYEDELEGKFLDDLYNGLKHTSKNLDTANTRTAVGTFRMVTSFNGSGNIYWDDSVVDIFFNLSGITLTIGGFISTAADLVVLSVAHFIGQTINEINQNASATAKLGHSYRYLVKEGQVYTSSGWVTYYSSTSRESYRHDYATYIDSQALTKQDTKDYTTPYRTQYAPNYSDDNYIQNEALTRWYNNQNPGEEDWNGVKPDPDPQRVKMK